MAMAARFPGGMGFGFRSVRPASVGGGAPAPVDLESLAYRSIRFPQVNQVMGNDNPDGAVLAIDAEKFRAGGSGATAVLVPANGDAIAVKLLLPWERTFTRNSGPAYIFGNSFLSGSHSYNLAFFPLANSASRYGFQFKADGAAQKLNLLASIAAAPETELQIVIRTTPTDVFLEVISCADGTVLGSATVAVSTFAGVFCRGNIGLGGLVAYNSTDLTTTAYFKTGFTMAFPGELREFLYYDGAGVPMTQADAQAIALGADPVARMGVNKFRVALALDDPGDLDKRIPNAESVVNPVPMVAAKESGALIAGGGSIGRQSTADYVTIDHVPEGTVWAGAVNLSGTASLADGQQVEVRVFSAFNGAVALDWTACTVTAGVWSLNAAAANTFKFAFAEARAKADPDNPNLNAYSRRYIGVGYNTTGWGQSQFDMWLENVQASGGVSVAGVLPVSVSALTDKATGDVRGYNTLASDGEQPTGSGFLATALYLASLTDAPIGIVAQTRGGTGLDDLMDDALTIRPWTDAQLLAALGGNGKSGHLIQWGTTDAGQGIQYKETRLDPFWLGDPGGLAFTVDHHIGATGEDAVAARTAKLMVCPLTRHGRSVVNDGINNPVTPDDESEATGGSYRIIRDEQNAFVAANPATTLMGVAFNDIAMTDPVAGTGTGPHQDVFADDRGNPRLGVRLAQSYARLLGLDNHANPTVSGVEIVAGSFVMSVVLPNGGTLITGSQNTGGSVPVGEQPVQGIEILRDGAGSWTRSGFTASITDNGAGTGIGKVTVVPTGADYTAADQLRWNFGDLCFDYDYEDVIEGLLYEARGDEGTHGVPIAIEVGLPVPGPAGPFSAA